MIVGRGKPLNEIVKAIAGSRSILVLGCGECVTVCHAGGRKEVDILAAKLAFVLKRGGDDACIETAVVERQCDGEFLEELVEIAARMDIIVSLGCGAGVQTVADFFPETPIVPGLNTRFMGAHTADSRWDERCAGCGDCVVGDFAGYCPVTRCSKSLMNGPCGGSTDGKCEIDPDIDCVWQQIIDRMIQRNQLDRLLAMHAPKDWRSSLSGGVRNQVSEVDNH